MIRDTLKKIEDTVRSAPKASAETKQQLLEQLGDLSAELEALERTHQEHARSIASFAQMAAHEATRAAGPPTLAEQAREGLAASVNEFEASHPRLAGLVRAIADSLANVGI